MFWSELAACCAVLLVALYLARRKDFVIRVGPSGRFDCEGLLPKALQQELAQLLLHDLNLRGPVTILGKRSGNRIRLWFRGPLTPGEQQRIRNFLAMHR
jgi:hypothetical protein